MSVVAIGDEITTITFQNTSSSVKTNEPITFGHMFKEGDLPATGAAVELRSPASVNVPCQMDIKSTFGDGSVKHAILSALITLGASASDVYSIRRKASGPVGTAAVPADFAGLNATATIVETGVLLGGPVEGETYTADASVQLASNQYVTWLSGPIVSEWIIRAPLMSSSNVEHPDLHARFHIRAYAGQARAKIDYMIENNWAKKKATPSGVSPWEIVSVTDKIYRVTMKAGAATVYTRAVAGYQTTKLSNSAGLFDGNLTGLPNTSSVYNAVITVDGVAKSIAIMGSAAQNYGQLKALLTTQLGGAATVGTDPTNLCLVFTSATTGPNSSVTISYGTLFPAIGHVTLYRPIFGDEVLHYAGARWKKTFWWGATPTVHIGHDKVYLMASKAVPNYKASLTGDATTINTVANNMANNGDIGANGVTKSSFGDVGFSPGIGILPEWVAMYLVNQGVTAKTTMLKQADLSGGWPVNVRDYTTDRPISFTDWPYVTFSPNGGDSTNPATNLQEKLPSRVPATTLQPTKMLPDVAHHPDFNYVPYIVTGDYFYLEQQMMYQRYASYGNAHASYRDGAKCLWRRDQVRGQAWSLRTTVHALYAMPDNYPLKADMLYILEQNRLNYMADHTVFGGSKYNVLGIVAGAEAIVYASNTGTGVFQDDFMTSATGRAIELGFNSWVSWLNFKTRFCVGRLTSGVSYCWQLAAPLSLVVRPSASAAIFTTFNEVYMASFNAGITGAQCGTQAMTTAMSGQEGSRTTLNSMAGYPDIVGGYPSNLQPAVAYASTFNVSGGNDAWTVFEGRSLKPNYNLGPQFAIEPRPPEPVNITALPDNYTGTVGQIMYIGSNAP